MADDFAQGLVGVTLDQRYRLDALVGEGGMGAVFRAQHLAMDRRVAVKLLKPHLTTDKTQLERFAREARSTLRVDSPHAVKVLDFGVTPHRDYYMVLEYLDGRTVQRELDVDGPFTPARAIHITRQALHALAAAHRSGLVHRDIKPDNVLLMRQGEDPDFAKVLDFGVAKLMDGAARSTRSQLAITQAGMVFGTPAFVSPEQACGLPLDGRSDLYSLAATLFAMLTGCALFEASTAIAFLTHHARTPPPRLGDVAPALAAHRELDEFLQRCLAKPREERPSDAEEMDRLLAAIPLREGDAPVEEIERVAPAIATTKTPTTAALKAALSSSSFFDALDGPAAAAVAATVEAAAPASPRADTEAAPGVRRARGSWMIASAIAAVAIVGIAIGVAMTRRSPQRAEPPPPARVAEAPPKSEPPPSTPIVREAPTDAGVLDAPARPPEPAPQRLPAPQRKQHAPAAAPSAAIVDEHLAKASAALRDNQRITYLHWAEEAHKANPRNVRARLMFADALIQNGSKPRGCAHYRALKHLAAAREQASSAGCPVD